MLHGSAGRTDLRWTHRSPDPRALPLAAMPRRRV